MLTMSLTSKYALFKKGYGSFASDIYRLPAPNMYRIPQGMTDNDYIDHCIAQLEHAFIAQVDASAVAAILIEPIQGEGGFIPMPKKFLEKIREICDQNGILFIADEIQSGFGRTGKLFALNHYNIQPDLITLAKSMGAGLPIAAVVGKAEIMDKPHLGAIGGTYGGSPITCVAAIEAIKIITNPDFEKHSNHIGTIIEQTLLRWKNTYKYIGDVRGVGAMRLIEFVHDTHTKKPNPEIAIKIIKHATTHGIVLIRAGLYSNCIRLLPPLVITTEQLHEGLQILENAIALYHQEDQN
jgi:4-aminobutyrate aminotransferase/(S)-3-amino-2-methylpropionate transaminase